SHAPLSTDLSTLPLHDALPISDMRAVVEGFDASAMIYRWRHPSREVEELATAVFCIVAEAQRMKLSRRQVFADLWRAGMRDPLRSGEQPSRLPSLTHIVFRPLL